MMWRTTRRLALKTLWVGSTLPATLQPRAHADTDVAALLRAGACVLVLRHAQTEAGIGDPSNFQPSQCNTQRNLSVEGQAQSKRIAQWFAARKLEPSSVQSSAWCRCKDTATLAFGRFDLLPALNSSFNRPGTGVAQSDVLRERLKGVRTGQFEVWVTHQVNITSMTGEGTAMGEALVIRAGDGSSNIHVMGRIRFT